MSRIITPHGLVKMNAFEEFVSGAYSELGSQMDYERKTKKLSGQNKPVSFRYDSENNNLHFTDCQVEGSDKLRLQLVNFHKTPIWFRSYHDDFSQDIDEREIATAVMAKQYVSMMQDRLFVFETEGGGRHHVELEERNGEEFGYVYYTRGTIYHDQPKITGFMGTEIVFDLKSHNFFLCRSHHGGLLVPTKF